MERQYLISLINEGNSLRKIASLTKKSLTSIRYWVVKHELSLNTVSFKQQTKKDYSTTRECPKCKLLRAPDEFYKKRETNSASSYCKTCTTQQTIERQKKFKQLSLEYKGGKCVICDYDRCQSALEFHHLNPKEKDFSISQGRLTTFNDKIKKELDKCILVCANCHREIHEKMHKVLPIGFEPTTLELEIPRSSN